MTWEAWPIKVGRGSEITVTATDSEQWQRLSLSEAAHWPTPSITFRREEAKRGEDEGAGEDGRVELKRWSLEGKEQRRWNLRRDHMKGWGERWWKRGRAGSSRVERKTVKRQNGGEESRNETKGSRDLKRQERRGGERKIWKEKRKRRGWCRRQKIRGESKMYESEWENERRIVRYLLGSSWERKGKNKISQIAFAFFFFISFFVHH